MTSKLEILQAALITRDEEILGYQINIDNYDRAISKINADHADNPSIVAFRDNLIEQLAAHKIEQLKAIIIRDVIADQVEELEASQ